MGRAGGLRFYNDKQNTSILFWSYAASCMFAFLVFQFPQLDREDVIHPDFSDTTRTWCGFPTTYSYCAFVS